MHKAEQLSGAVIGGAFAIWQAPLDCGLKHQHSWLCSPENFRLFVQDADQNVIPELAFKTFWKIHELARMLGHSEPYAGKDVFLISVKLGQAKIVCDQAWYLCGNHFILTGLRMLAFMKMALMNLTNSDHVCYCWPFVEHFLQEDLYSVTVSYHTYLDPSLQGVVWAISS